MGSLLQRGRWLLRNHASPREVELHYFDLLNALYGDEFPFAQLMDSSDLVARFEGPAVSGRDPTVSIVTLMCSDLRQQIRRIAKSIVGLSGDDRTRWPNELDPQLAGITRGSLVIWRADSGCLRSSRPIGPHCRAYRGPSWTRFGTLCKASRWSLGMLTGKTWTLQWRRNSRTLRFGIP